MQPTGPKLGEGRDSEIFAVGADRVLRRVRDGRSLVAEADVMRHARAHGYPCPAVHDAGHGYLVMDRVDGPSLAAWAGRAPSRIRPAGRILGALHQQLHAIPATPASASAPADRLVHGDLHPLNVLVTDAGPIVIDWANAGAGDPGVDLADTWATLACLGLPAGRTRRALDRAGRRVMLHGFLAVVDRQAAAQAIPAAVQRRLADRQLTEAERRQLTGFAARHGR